MFHGVVHKITLAQCFLRHGVGLQYNERIGRPILMRRWQVCAMLLGARHVPECLCGGCLLECAITNGRPLSLKCVKRAKKLLWRAYRNSTTLFRACTASAFPRLGVCNPHPKLQSLLSQEQVTFVKFGWNIHRIHPKRSPLKILEKRERGLTNFFGYPYYLRNLWTSNFVCTFIGLIGTKAHLNFWESSSGCCQGLLKIFRAAIYRVHRARAVILAIAQLSCVTCFWTDEGIEICLPVQCN